MQYQEIQEFLATLKGTQEFLLSKDHFLGLDDVGFLLENGIGQCAIQLTGLLSEPEQGRLTGSAESVIIQKIPLHSVRLCLQFTEFGKSVHTSLEIQSTEPAQEPFGSLKTRFAFTDMQYTYRFQRHGDRLSETGSCECRIKLSEGTALPVHLYFVPGSSYVLLMDALTDAEPGGIPIDLTDAIALLGVEGAAGAIPQDLRELLRKGTIRQLSLEYETPTDRITRFSIALAVAGAAWKPAEGFDAVLDGVALEVVTNPDGKTGFTASVSGSFRLEDLTLPVRLGFSTEGEQVFVQLGGDTPARLGSLASLASLIGEVDTSALPVQAAAFYLDELLFSYSIAQKKVSDFSLELSIEEPWELPGLFRVREIVFCVSMEDGAAAYRLLGVFQLAAVEIQLEADYGADGWSLYGFTGPDQKIQLAGLAYAVTGAGEMVELPDFWLSDLHFFCKPGNSAYELEGTAGVSVSRAPLSRLSARFGLLRETGRTCFGICLEGSLDFSSLPFVGGAAEELDAAALRHLAFFYTDQPVSDVSIVGIAEHVTAAQAGLYFLLELDLPTGPSSFCLPLCTAKQEALLSAANGSVGFHGSVSVNKSIGPFSMQRLLLSYGSGELGVGLSASFAPGGLSLSLDSLFFTYGISDKSIRASLAGLSLSIAASGFSLEGGFLRENTETERYSGSVRAQAGVYGLTLYGAYEAKPYPSAFLFGLLCGNIGGPPCFLMTGIAAGFGYSRTLLVPPIDKLEDFALLAVLSGKQSAESILREADRAFPAKAGANWVAAGITATSFQMVDLAVLASVLLDHGFCLNLLGCAELRIPKGAKSPVAQAGLLIKVTIDPDSGVIPIDGMLTRDSYVLSPDCHIRGGFAFYLWYAGQHAGDFVLTFGGYRNGYAKPAHYPSPDRLALSWKLSRELSVEGSLYFALTPSCIMAGGDFQMVFQWKCVCAWFHAYTDIFIGWKPYSYDLSIGISLGVRVDLKLFRVQLELGCDLAIWGPDFTGRADIHLWIISFSIKFGNGERKRDPIPASEFRESFLPKPGDANRLSAAAGEFGAPVILLESGVTGSHRQDAEKTTLAANAQQLVLTVKSPVPLTAFTLNGAPYGSQGGTAPLYLRPCEKAASPKLVVEICRCDGKPVSTVWEVSEIQEDVPAALWAAAAYTGETIKRGTGLSIRAAQGRPYRSLTCRLGCREAEREPCIPAPPQLASPEYDQSQGYEMLRQLNSPETEANRKRFLEGLPGLADAVDLSGWDGPVFLSKPVLKGTGGKWYA